MKIIFESITTLVYFMFAVVLAFMALAILWWSTNEVYIAIAVSVERLVYIFKTRTTNITHLIYPSVLILTAVLVIIGLGIYQKLSATVEK